MRLRGSIAFALSFAFGISSPAPAQQYPARPVRIIVPFGAGGALDAVACAFNTELGAALGQPFIVENRAGAGGVIGTVASLKWTKVIRDARIKPE